jgi:hypothetical protein
MVSSKVRHIREGYRIGDWVPFMALIDWAETQKHDPVRTRVDRLQNHLHVSKWEIDQLVSALKTNGLIEKIIEQRGEAAMITWRYTLSSIVGAANGKRKRLRRVATQRYSIH